MEILRYLTFWSPNHKSYSAGLSGLCSRLLHHYNTLLNDCPVDLVLFIPTYALLFKLH